MLDGKTILLNPGHNGGNFEAPVGHQPADLERPGKRDLRHHRRQTDSGYPEAQFNWNVARYLTADLRAAGATVVFTRTTSTDAGRASPSGPPWATGAHANAAISIHADGGPPGGRGFAILEPVADGINNAISASSAFAWPPTCVTHSPQRPGTSQQATTEPTASSHATTGSGTNLSTVPKVFIECANMRNPTDAALLVSPILGKPEPPEPSPLAGSPSSRHAEI